MTEVNLHEKAVWVFTKTRKRVNKTIKQESFGSTLIMTKAELKSKNQISINVE